MTNAHCTIKKSDTITPREKMHQNKMYEKTKIKETYDKHINITKEIYTCTKTSEPISKENETEYFDFYRVKLQGTQL